MSPSIPATGTACLTFDRQGSKLCFWYPKTLARGSVPPPLNPLHPVKHGTTKETPVRFSQRAAEPSPASGRTGCHRGPGRCSWPPSLRLRPQPCLGRETCNSRPSRGRPINGDGHQPGGGQSQSDGQGDQQRRRICASRPDRNTGENQQPARPAARVRKAGVRIFPTPCIWF